MVKIRDGEKFGHITLSIQASAFHYCSPRVDGLPLEEYTSVEVAIIGKSGNFIPPSSIGAPELNHLFRGDDVAGYVSQEDLAKFRNACARYTEFNL